MRNKPILEVCAFHIDLCLIAEKCGSARVTLCDNPIEGGTTPSYGTIKNVREKISILLYPILRPRSGNYFYSDEEFAILKDDIKMCKELGCNGISVGLSHIDSKIDIERLKRVVDWAGGMGVTCNRVFDCALDPFEALENIIACGCERILTSGQKAAAPDATDLLKRLVKQARNRISIMPGAGVKSSNIAKLKKETGANEFHSSARKIAPNPVTYINKEVNDYGNVYIADEEEVKAMIAALDY
jgi:copper homeostasis protein